MDAAAEGPPRRAQAGSILTTSAPHGFWPSGRHRMLLHACLDAPDEALAAWRGWRELVGFNDVDVAEMRLLPLAHANLGESIREDPVHGRVSGLVRMTWTQNQLLFRRAAGAIEALEGAGIETLMLKGAPLALLHYETVAVRPMADVDILVRPRRAEEAMRVLREHGWTPGREPAEAVLPAHHSHGFHDEGLGEIDLHWFSLWQSGDDEPL